MTPDSRQRKRKRLGECPICLQHGDLEKEDWIPLWVRRTLIVRMAIPGQQPPRAQTLVCERCNKRMGKLFEEPTSLVMRPLFTGDPALLSARDQQTIATWIVKTNLVRAIATEWGRERLLPNGIWVHRVALAYLMETRLPPVATSVRLGCFEPSVLSRGISLEPSTDSQVRIPSPDWEGPFLINIVHSGALLSEMFMGSSVDVERFISATSSDDRLTRIWPPTSSEVNWPPNVLLPGETYADLRAAWQHGPETYAASMEWQIEDA